MTRAVAALAVVVAVASPGRAHASSCKGGVLDLVLDVATEVVSAAADAPSASTDDPDATCSDAASDVHGHRRCSKFGGWGRAADRSPWFIEAGVVVRGFASPLGERDDTLSHDGRQFVYRVVGPAARPGRTATIAAVVQGRVGRAVGHGLFVAADAEIGAVGGAAAPPEMISSSELGRPDIREAGVTATSGLAVAGWRGQADNLTLGLELAGGFRALTYHFDSSFRACETTASITAWMPVLEGRARAAYRVSPDLAIGATGGKSAIDDAWLAGVFVSVHSFE